MADADPLAVVVRLGLYAVLGVLFGLPVFVLYARTGNQGIAAMRRWLGVGAISGLLLSALGLAVLAAGMIGAPLRTLDRDSLQIVATLPDIGTAWQIRMLALGLILVAALVINHRQLLAAAAAGLGGVALASLAWTGHGRMSEGTMGAVHLASDIVHLLAAGAWLGALAGLLHMVARPAAGMPQGHIGATHAALAGFAMFGSAIVGLIVLSGLVNAWTIIGIEHIGGLFTTLYGQLFLAKLALFVGMLGLAASNRFRLTPALERRLKRDANSEITALRVSIAIETAAALAILSLVAWLGLLSPPGSMG